MRYLVLLALLGWAAALPAQEQQQQAPAKTGGPQIIAPKTEPAKPEAAKQESPNVITIRPSGSSTPPRHKQQRVYDYDLNRNPTRTRGAAADRQGQVTESRDTLPGYDGKPVTVRQAEQRVLRDQEKHKVLERRIQRYDPTGKPTSQQVVRTETRKMPDGSEVTTEVLYETDLNGRLQFTERRTTTKKETPSGATSATLVERPAAAGGRTEVVERIDRTETKRGESVVEALTSLKRLDANGRLAEREREFSVATKSGNATTTEAKQWEIQLTGKLELVGRSSSKLIEHADGSQVEEKEVYTTRIAGTTPDLNRPGVPTLEQQVLRERKVQPNGKIVETTTVRHRTVAEPNRLGGLMVEEQVITPTADGRTIEKTLSERDANGRLAAVAKVVEEEKQ